MHDLTLPDGTPMFHLHRGECLFLFDEIFTRRCYAGDGLVLDEPGDGCIVDVGANIGMASLFFHAQAPGKRIHAFEPSPATFAVLAANVARLGIDATLHRCALAASDGTAELTHYPNKSTQSGLYADVERDRGYTRTYMINEGLRPDDADQLLRDAFRPERVPCRTRALSSVIREHGITRIDLLKIDVEKAELDVLRGIADEDWPRIRQLAVEVHDLDGRVACVMELLRARGFTAQVRQDPLLRDTDLYDVIARAA